MKYITQLGLDFIAERSALPRIVTTKGKDSPYDDETDVVGPGYWSGDPDDVSNIKRRRKEFATHIKRIRKGKAEPEQQRVDPDAPHKEVKYGEIEPQPPRKGPGSQGETHAQAAADIKSNLMYSRGREHEGHVKDAERDVRGREDQALRSKGRVPANIIKRVATKLKQKQTLQAPKFLRPRSNESLGSAFKGMASKIRQKFSKKKDPVVTPKDAPAPTGFGVKPNERNIGARSVNLSFRTNRQRRTDALNRAGYGRHGRQHRDYGADNPDDIQAQGRAGGLR